MRIGHKQRAARPPSWLARLTASNPGNRPTKSTARLQAPLLMSVGANAVPCLHLIGFCVMAYNMTPTSWLNAASVCIRDDIVSRGQSHLASRGVCQEPDDCTAGHGCGLGIRGRDYSRRNCFFRSTCRWSHGRVGAGTNAAGASPAACWSLRVPAIYSFVDPKIVARLPSFD